MSMEGDFRTLLLSFDGITALIGGSSTPRFFSDTLPQDETRDSIVFVMLPSTHQRDLEGTANYAFARVQVDCWSTKRKGTLDLRKAIKDAVDGYGPATVGATLFHSVSLMLDFYGQDEDEPQNAATTVPLRRQILEFEVQFSDLTN